MNRFDLVITLIFLAIAIISGSYLFYASGKAKVLVEKIVRYVESRKKRKMGI